MDGLPSGEWRGWAGARIAELTKDMESLTSRTTVVEGAMRNLESRLFVIQVLLAALIVMVAPTNVTQLLAWLR